MKRDWIYCNKQNYENNTICRWCKRDKSDGVKEIVEVDIEEGRKGREENRRKENTHNESQQAAKNKETGTSNDNGSKEYEKQKPQIMGKHIGAKLRCRKGREENNDGKIIDMKFVKNEGKLITLEELDEALCIENKDKTEIQ